MADQLDELPAELFEHRDVFDDVVGPQLLPILNEPFLQNTLDQFLPSNLSHEQRQETLRQLLNNQLSNFGRNPMDSIFMRMKLTKLSPDLLRTLDEVKQLKLKALRLEEQKLQCDLLNDVMQRRKQLLEKLLNQSPAAIQQKLDEGKLINDNQRSQISDSRLFCNAVNRYKTEMGESTDEDYDDLFLSVKPMSVFGNKQPPRAMSEIQYRYMLRKHVKRRACQLKQKEDISDEESLDTKGISLDDVITRSGFITDHEEQFVNLKKRKNGEISSFEGADTDVLTSSTSKTKRIKLDEETSKATSVSTSDVKQETSVVDVVSTGQPTCFFSLLRDIFYSNPTNENKLSLNRLEELVKERLEKVDASFGWNVQLVKFAMNYLSGVLPPPHIVPLVDYREKNQQWQWIGAGRDQDEMLVGLCEQWLIEHKRKPSITVRSNTIPPPSCPTTWTVKASTAEEKQLYRTQEAQRYQQPHKAFTFYTHGYTSVVGPVKGCAGLLKDSNVTLISPYKARDHSVLVRERPSFVTLLSIVRDSAARLPNGEGTRADICELLRDSQYLLDSITDQQVNTIVSGALDRLHYEKDPCVKYDVTRRIWIYLHRNRSEQDFEHLHQMQMEAAKAKRDLRESQRKGDRGEQLIRSRKTVISQMSHLQTSKPKTSILIESMDVDKKSKEDKAIDSISTGITTESKKLLNGNVEVKESKEHIAETLKVQSELPFTQKAKDSLPLSQNKNSKGISVVDSPKVSEQLKSKKSTNKPKKKDVEPVQTPAKGSASITFVKSDAEQVLVNSRFACKLVQTIKPAASNKQVAKTDATSKKIKEEAKLIVSKEPKTFIIDSAKTLPTKNAISTAKSHAVIIANSQNKNTSIISNKVTQTNSTIKGIQNGNATSTASSTQSTITLGIAPNATTTTTSNSNNGTTTHRISIPTSMLFGQNAGSVVLATSNGNALNGIKSFVMSSSGGQIVLHPQGNGNTTLLSSNPGSANKKNSGSPNPPLALRTIQGIRVVPVSSSNLSFINGNGIQSNGTANVVARIIATSSTTRNGNTAGKQIVIPSTGGSLQPLIISTGSGHCGPTGQTGTTQINVPLATTHQLPTK